MDELGHLRSIGISDEWDYPVVVLFFFYRKTKRKFDLHNMVQGPMDVLVELDVIKDDDMNHAIVAFDGCGWAVDRDNPRVEMKIFSKGYSKDATEKESPSSQIQTRKRPVTVLSNANTVRKGNVPESINVI